MTAPDVFAIFCLWTVASVVAAACISALLAERGKLQGFNAVLLDAVQSLEGDVRRNLDHTLRLLQPSSCGAPGPAAGAQPASFSEVAWGAAAPRCRPRPGEDYAVAAVLSGRRDRMSLLLPYLDALLAGGLLDEVHLWDYSRGPQDRAWLREVAPAHGYRLFEVERPDNRHLALYEFYSGPDSSQAPRFRPACAAATPNSTVVAKVDDDVVFVDVESFPAFARFVRERPEVLLVHANVVNNGVAAFYQSRRVPLLRSALPALSAYPERHWRPGMGGELMYSAAMALRLHELFVQAPESFAWEDPAHGDCVAFAPPPGVGSVGLGQGQFSVNFFAARWAVWGELRDLVRCVDVDYDEPSVTVLATRLGHRECMFTRFNVAHLSFGPQDGDPSVAQALQLYRELLARRGPAGPLRA